MLTPIVMVLSAALSAATTQAQTPMVSDMYHAAGTIVDINEDTGRFWMMLLTRSVSERANIPTDGFQ